MPDSVGNTASRKAAELIVWRDAVDWLDSKFENLRNRAMQKWANDRCMLARFLEVHTRKWTVARARLVRTLLTRQQKGPQYERTRTLNPTCAGKKKTKPRNSYVQLLRHHPAKKRRRGNNNKRRSGRSHHQGTYQRLHPDQAPGRHRPNVPANVKAARKKAYERDRQRWRYMYGRDAGLPKGWRQRL